MSPETISYIEELYENDTIIISFCSKAYIDMAVNWCGHMESLGINNYVIISLDNETFKTLAYYSINTIHISNFNIPNRNRFSVWVKRLKCFKNLIQNGINFIHCDVDAIWLRNDFSWINYDYDMTMSQGLIFPKKFYSEKGFVMCMGLFYCKSNNRTLEYFKFILRRVRDNGDDQQVFNNSLLRLNAEIIDDSENMQVLSPIRIFVLDKNTVSRTKEDRNERTIIHHPFEFVDKNVEEKIKIMKSEGIYDLEDDWRKDDITQA